MPVANPDLLSPEPILFRPPNFEYSFKNPAFRAIELVLNNMNNPNYGMKYYSDLEKIVHAAHMQDIWTAGGLAYKKFQVHRCTSKTLFSTRSFSSLILLDI